MSVRGLGPEDVARFRAESGAGYEVPGLEPDLRAFGSDRIAPPPRFDLATPRKWAPSGDPNTTSSGDARAFDAYGRFHLPESRRLADALTELGEIDDETAEENLPQVGEATKAEAERLVRALTRRAPARALLAVYPTQDAGIALHFKVPDRPGAVLVLLRDDGRADCHAYIGGRSPAHPLRNLFGPARRMDPGSVAPPDAVSGRRFDAGRGVLLVLDRGSVDEPAVDAVNTRSGSIQGPPTELDANEDLGRAAFDRRSRNRALRGVINHRVFLASEQAASISVDRMDHAPIDELAAWSRERARSRGTDRRFYGWAVLKVRDAEEDGRNVAATPTPQNRCHADIFLNITATGEERRRQQEEHALQLAEHSRWREAPVDSNPG